VPCSCLGTAHSGRPAAVRTLDVLRYAVRAGVNHIDIAQFYGPDVANDLICEALYPYPEELVLVSKLGARRDDSGGIRSAQSPEQLREGVLANLDSLRLDQVPVVNLRRHPEAGVPLDEQVAAIVAMRDQGLIGAVGLSGVGPRRSGARRARVQ
jgi:pyridoxine 4-dehydrogenase